jgi:hypothetical protein
MPISITGSTGPILIMTTVMYDMSNVERDWDSYESIRGSRIHGSRFRGS